MKQKHILSFLLLFVTCTIEAQNKEQKLIGNWYAQDLSRSTIQIYQDKTGAFFGKIIESADHDKIGKTPLMNFKFNAKENKFVGQIKPASTPFELSGEIRFIDDKTLQLVGHRLFLTKTFTLTKL